MRKHVGSRARTRLRADQVFPPLLDGKGAQKLPNSCISYTLEFISAREAELTSVISVKGIFSRTMTG